MLLKVQYWLNVNTTCKFNKVYLLDINPQKKCDKMKGIG